jgi:hypothetical protein
MLTLLGTSVDSALVKKNLAKLRVAVVLLNRILVFA